MAGRINGSVSDVIATLQQTAGNLVKTVNDAMQEEMTKIQKAAIARAPVEHGNLEDAIKIQNVSYRRHWIVYVDDSMPDDTGKYTVGDYAMWLHEGVYQLGPASEAKASSNGQPVGRKFLEGPFEEAIQKGLVERLQNALNEELARRGR